MYSVTQFLKSNARATPNAPATRYLDRAYSWSQMQDRVARLAAALRAQGIEVRDRVAILALNSDRYLEVYFATWWAGAVVVPMNTRWSLAESTYALEDAEPRVMFIDDAFAPMLPALAAAADLSAVVFTGEAATPAAALDYESLIASHAPCGDAERAGDDLAGLYYTGGTTGFPKGGDAHPAGALVQQSRSQQRIHLSLDRCIPSRRAHVPPGRRRLLRSRLHRRSLPHVSAEL